MLERYLVTEKDSRVLWELAPRTLTETLLDAIPQPLFFKDNEGCYLACNKAFCEFWGKQREQLLDKTVFEVAATPQAETYHQADLNLMQTGGTQIYEAQMVDSDGLVHDVVFHKAVLVHQGQMLGLGGSVTDVTSINALHKQLISKRAKLAAVLDAVPEMIAFTDSQGQLQGCNRPLREFAGVGQEAELVALFRRRCHGAEAPFTEIDVPNAAQQTVTLELRHIVMQGEQQELLGHCYAAKDISHRKVIERRLEYMATHDPLTQAANRALLLVHLDSAMARARRHHQTLAVLYIDLDDFKQVNDGLGHDAGDQLLCAVVRRLQAVLRQQDLIARVGGDEFVVVFEELQPAAELPRLVTKVQAALEPPVKLEVAGKTLEQPCRFSLGLARYPVDGDSSDALLSAADQAMYCDKRRRKGLD